MTKGEQREAGKILYAVSAAGTALTFLKGQLGYIANAGYVVGLACPPAKDDRVEQFCADEGVKFLPLNLQRDPGLRADFKAMVEAFLVIGRFSPDIVIAGTPKASLLTLFAARVRRVPVRVYLCHGLRYEGYTGPRRYAMRQFERVVSALSTKVVAVSDSVRAGLVRCKVPTEKVVVLGDGSPNGVDILRFTPVQDSEPAGDLPEGEFILFVGRLSKDKGLSHLVELAVRLSDVPLVIVGPIEAKSVNEERLAAQLRELPNVRMLGRRSDVASLMSRATVLVLPSVREGMPTVLLEAAACGLPVVAMKATGSTDAVERCESGILVEQGDAHAFVDMCRTLLRDDCLRNQFSQRGRENASRKFAQELVWQRWLEFLEEEWRDVQNRRRL